MARTCQHCSRDIPESAVFCPYCGNRYVDPATVCSHCGTTVIPGASFCPTCGNPVERIKEKKPVAINFVKVGALIKASIVLALCILMLVMAFLPTYTLTYEDMVGKTAADQMENEGLDPDTPIIRMGTVQHITLMFDSLRFLDAEELKDTKLYERAEDLIEEMGSYPDFSDDDTARAFSELMYVMSRLGAMYDGEDNLGGLIDVSHIKTPAVTMNAILCGVISLVYLATAIVATVFGALYFVDVLLGKKTNVSYRRMLFTFALQLAMAIATHAFQCGGGGNYHIGGAYLTVIIVSALAFLAEWVIKTLRARWFDWRTLVRSGVAVALCIVLLSGFAMPILGINVDTRTFGKEDVNTYHVNVGIDFYSTLSMTPEDYEDSMDTHSSAYTKDAFDQSYALLRYFTSKQIKRGDVAAMTSFQGLLLITLYMGGQYEGLAFAYLFILAYFLFALLIAFVFAYAISSLFIERVKGSTPLRAVLVFLTVVMLAGAIVLVAVAGANIDEFDIDHFEVVIGSGSIVMLICANILCWFPFWSRHRWFPAPEQTEPAQTPDESPVAEGENFAVTESV